MFHALEGDPAVANNLLMRSRIVHALQTRIATWNLSQVQAAKRLGITQPRLNELLKGRIDRFSLDALIKLLHPAGLTVDLRVTSL